MAAKPCRVCSDFKKWSRVQQKRPVTKECPLDGEELGRATWAFLHTAAAYYPDKPSADQQHDMKQFISLMSKIYPCESCADHMQSRLKTHPPGASEQKELALWMCQLHNEVNERLGKPQFDCSTVNERWLVGWKGGSCD
nr:augmenter of liver regeneration [Halisarca dujardinii]QZX63211.1 mitochondrial FAD-linked sulfhydryl oxidase [Halisarca dujardinii]